MVMGYCIWINQVKGSWEKLKILTNKTRDSEKVKIERSEKLWQDDGLINYTNFKIKNEKNIWNNVKNWPKIHRELTKYLEAFLKASESWGYKV